MPEMVAKADHDMGVSLKMMRLDLANGFRDGESGAKAFMIYDLRRMVIDPTDFVEDFEGKGSLVERDLQVSI